MTASSRTGHRNDWVIVDNLIHGSWRIPFRPPTILEVREAIHVLNLRKWSPATIANRLALDLRTVRDHLSRLATHRAQRDQEGQPCSTQPPRSAATATSSTANARD